LVTRWPMFGMETIPEVYFIWIQSRLYEAGVELITDHFVEQLDPGSVTLFNVYRPEAKRELDADWVVMATGRRSENSLYRELRERCAQLVGGEDPAEDDPDALAPEAVGGERHRRRDGRDPVEPVEDGEGDERVARAERVGEGDDGEPAEGVVPGEQMPRIEAV